MSQPKNNEPQDVCCIKRERDLATLVDKQDMNNNIIMTTKSKTRPCAYTKENYLTTVL